MPPIMVYTWSFTAATPDFRCHHPTNREDTYSNKSNELFTKIYRPTTDECKHYKKMISVKECQRCYRKSNSSKINQIQTCDNYVFDRSIYQTTLVEEVNFLTSIFGFKKV